MVSGEVAERCVCTHALPVDGGATATRASKIIGYMPDTSNTCAAAGNGKLQPKRTTSEILCRLHYVCYQLQGKNTACNLRKDRLEYLQGTSIHWLLQCARYRQAT